MDWGAVASVINSGSASVQDKFEAEQKYWNGASPNLVGPMAVPEFKNVLQEAIGNLVNLSEPYIKLLDFGCGTGRAYKALAPGCRYTGVDMSESFLKHFSQSYPNADLVLINEQWIPFPDNYFHIIICYSVLTHVPIGEQCHLVMSELHRVLRSGGPLIVSVFHNVNPSNNWVVYGKEEWEKELTSVGFRVFKVTQATETSATVCQSLYTLIK